MKKMDESSSATDDSDGKKSCTRPSEAIHCYEIRFKGHLDDHWAARFHGCSLTREDDGTTTMVAPVKDQAELFGLLNKVRDLSLLVISVNEIEPPEETEVL
ncbi:MAG: hypothetical protein WA996_20095 [Candidatus Promineifilaceae bacterium]